MLHDILAAMPLGLFLAFMLGPVFFVLLETAAIKGFRAAISFDLGVIIADTVFLFIAYLSTTKLLERIKDDPEVLLLSHTVMPRIDTVAQLKRYAEEKGVIDSKWNLVTGDKKQIYDLARKSYLAAKSEGDGGKYDMVHTENFVLIDKNRQIRGFYDGSNPEAIEELMEDLKILKKEYQE